MLAMRHLDHEVDGASVGRDGHSAARRHRLLGAQGDHSLTVRQSLDLDVGRLHQGDGGGVRALKVTWHRRAHSGWKRRLFKGARQNAVNGL